MENLKLVPFNLEKWREDGSKIERLETRNGYKIDAIHIFKEIDNSRECIAYIAKNTIRIVGLYINGLYALEYEDDSDLLMYVEPPIHFIEGTWKVVKIVDSKDEWLLTNKDYYFGRYRLSTKTLGLDSYIGLTTEDLTIIQNLLNQINSI